MPMSSSITLARFNKTKKVNRNSYENNLNKNYNFCWNKKCLPTKKDILNANEKQKMQLKFINNKTVLGYKTRQIIDCSFVAHRHVYGPTDGRMDGPIPLYLALQTMGATVMVYENEIFSIVFLA